jgi:HPt (histidine-containing phosphotransfer) domain-containing protein
MSDAIDLAHLARYTGGEKAMNAEILRLFDGQISEMVGQLRSVIAARDAKRWKEITHTIKGAARGVGAFSFGDAAAAAEPVDPANAERASQAISRLSEEAMAVHDFIRRYLAA